MLFLFKQSLSISMCMSRLEADLAMSAISSMQNAIVHEVETAVSNTKQNLLNSMAVLIDSRLNAFQSNIQQSQKDISDFQISKIEESVTDNFCFQRKGNKNQYKHSVKVMSKLKEACSILANPT